MLRSDLFCESSPNRSKDDTDMKDGTGDKDQYNQEYGGNFDFYFVSSKVEVGLEI